MKRVTYYPGCGLKEGAEGYELSLKSTLGALGVEAVELNDWNCCGTVYSLSDDEQMKKIAPIRNLVEARDQKVDVLYTACSMCYGVLKRAENFARTREEDMKKINNFMEGHDDYWGGVEVRHVSELLLESLEKAGIEAEGIGICLAPYYGCTLLRPDEVAIPDTIFEEILKRVGFEVVDYPEKARCCGGYHTLNKREITESRSDTIIRCARDAGADAIVLSCPLCEYNLAEISNIDIPILFLTQAVGLALGVKDLGLEFNKSNVEKIKKMVEPK